MANDGDVVMPLASCDEADSHMKRAAQQNNKKILKKATTASSKQLVIFPDNKDDSDSAAAGGGNDDHTRSWRRIESDFVVNYPRMDSRLHHLYPTGHMTGEGYTTIIKLMMTYLSQEELAAMEKKWVELYLEEIRVIGTKRMQLMEEQLDLIEKARETHKNQIEN
ncbi:hypothetical protein L6452_18924 [Arctium lappa]|uniref:Uncharacterized protein n=1 Tax=Arctium lappa TaxID=4217 RepID=A0ACB9B7Q6_ARCLA|nr:hypothetical protein L6452_18924 [Arctium lappa]